MDGVLVGLFLGCRGKEDSIFEVVIVSIYPVDDVMDGTVSYPLC